MSIKKLNLEELLQDHSSITTEDDDELYFVPVTKKELESITTEGIIPGIIILGIVLTPIIVCLLVVLFGSLWQKKMTKETLKKLQPYLKEIEAEILMVYDEYLAIHSFVRKFDIAGRLAKLNAVIYKIDEDEDFVVPASKQTFAKEVIEHLAAELSDSAFRKKNISKLKNTDASFFEQDVANGDIDVIEIDKEMTAKYGNEWPYNKQAISESNQFFTDADLLGIELDKQLQQKHKIASIDTYFAGDDGGGGYTLQISIQFSQKLFKTIKEVLTIGNGEKK